MNIDQEDKKPSSEQETDRDKSGVINGNMVTIGQSDITPTDGNLPTIGQNKGVFRTDMIDEALSKGQKNSPRIDAKTKTKDTGTKGTPRK